MHVFIGPYLEITEEIEIQERDLCASHERGEGSFCSQCGRHRDFQIQKMEISNLSDLYWNHDDWIDRMFPAMQTFDSQTNIQISTVLSNQRGTGGLHLKEKGIFNVPEKKKEIQKFLNIHQKDIDHLQSLDAKVSVQYGIVVYL